MFRANMFFEFDITGKYTRMSLKSQKTLFGLSFNCCQHHHHLSHDDTSIILMRVCIKFLVLYNKRVFQLVGTKFGK